MDKLYELLPLRYVESLRAYDYFGIRELRLKLGGYLELTYYERRVVLSSVRVEKDDIDFVIAIATDYSLYNAEERLRSGYLTRGGVRVGVSGECISFGGKTRFTVINGLCIRVPHDVEAAVSTILPYYIEEKLTSTLVIAPVGGGKTTMLRALIKRLIRRENVLVADERGELDLKSDNFGGAAFVIVGSDKKYALECGVRSLSPTALVTDELFGDADAVIEAAHMGVKIFASAHGATLDGIRRRKEFSRLFEEKVFERLVVLSSLKGAGTLEAVYDKNYNLLSPLC